MEIIEYIRGTNRHKKGVLYCGIDDNDSNKAIIGFSLCNKRDKFDHIGRKYEPGFGLFLTLNRAQKWATKTDYFIRKDPCIINHLRNFGSINEVSKSNILEIPPSIYENLKKFIRRSKRYFKNKRFPEWVEKIENNLPII